MPDTQYKFRQLVGDLRYLGDSTRRDISTVTYRHGCEVKCRTKQHCASTNAIIRYLINTLNVGITFKSGAPRPPKLALLQGYSDARFGGDPASCKSTTGILISYNGTPITWATKKQSLTALSTTEAEYISLASVTQHLQVAKRMCTAAGIITQSTCVLNSDSQSVCSMLSKPHGTKRRKFIDLPHHLIQQLIRETTSE